MRLRRLGRDGPRGPGLGNLIMVKKTAESEIGTDWRWTLKERACNFGVLFGGLTEPVVVLEDRWGVELAVLRKNQDGMWCWDEKDVGSSVLRAIQQHVETTLLRRENGRCA